MVDDVPRVDNIPRVDFLPQVEPYLPEVLNFPFGGLSSQLAETGLSRPENQIQLAWEKYSTSGRKMP